MQNILDIINNNSPKNLFNNHLKYNYCKNIQNLDKKLFILFCKNFFTSTKQDDNMKIKTVKYWLLHNLSLILTNEINADSPDLITDDFFWSLSSELEIIIDYFNVIFTGSERKTDRFIFLPVMNMFSNWCNLQNIDKIKVHHRLIKDLIYLDDNYFFFINYLKVHNKKFMVNVMRNHWEMEKGNNVLIHFFRSANFKNGNCSLKNFKKIINYLFDITFDILLKKNNNGKNAINLLPYLNKDFYNYVISKIIHQIGLKEFMKKYFSPTTKYINHFYQLEIILNFFIFNNDDSTLLEKIGENIDKIDLLYYRLVRNRVIMFQEKYLVINELVRYGLVDLLESDKELLGRKLWNKLKNSS